MVAAAQPADRSEQVITSQRKENVKDGKEFKGHSRVLSEASAFFHTLPKIRYLL